VHQPEVLQVVQAEAILPQGVHLRDQAAVRRQAPVVVHLPVQAAAHHQDREDAVKLLKNKS
jgi:hypothetical protein